MTVPGFGEAAERVRRSTVRITGAGRGGGSGVIWNEDGLVITNAHVAATDRATVELWDGRAVDGRVTGKDLRRDLAAIRVEAARMTGVEVRDSGGLRPGELVMAVGNPLGFLGALTTGVVHAVGPVRGLGRQPWIQADVRLAPGNSGGPLADARGRVVGLNTLIAGGLALAVPANSIRQFLERGGSAVPLGVVLRPVALRPGAELGMLLLEVQPRGAAARASLAPGDILTAANGHPFQSLDDLSDAIEASQGGTLPVTFLRGRRNQQRQVTLVLERAAAEAI